MTAEQLEALIASKLPDTAGPIPRANLIEVLEGIIAYVNTEIAAIET